MQMIDSRKNSTVIYMEELQEFQDLQNENIERLKEKLQ